MAFLWELLNSVFRIVFLRGSPERIYYTRRLGVVALLCAVLASGCAQWLYFDDHFVFVLLRVFAEVTLFMLMMVVLTAKIARFRLARMMLVLVIISLLTDIVLVLLSPVFSLEWLNVDHARDYAQYLGYGFGLVATYGAASVLSWGLHKPWVSGAMVIGAYIVGVVALNAGFRHLYQIIAAG